MIPYPSPNFEDRKGFDAPVMVVLHGTWTDSIAKTLSFLTDTNKDRAGGSVSCHYVIDRDGTIYQLVDESKRAWHAGKSQWRGIDDVNSASIGIELQNDSREAYADAQINALVALLKDIMARHGIAPDNIVGHEDVAPGRKDDPGAHFPWGKLAGLGVKKRDGI